MPRATKPQPERQHLISSIEPSKLAVIKSVRTDYQGNVTEVKYGRRFPSSYLAAVEASEGVSSGPKNLNPSPAFGNARGTALIDPYDNTDKAHFEDIFMADGTAQEALMLLVKFILGKRLQLVTDSRRYYPTEELRTQAVESIMSKQEYQNILVKVKEIDGKVKLHERLMGAQAQKYAFGRAALGIVFKDGLPVELKQFSSRNLGFVYADPKTWQLLGVQYHDLLVPPQNNVAKIFPAKDLLYFTNLDYNVKVSTLFYGVSKLKSCIGPSVAKRIILEEDMPEVAKSMWAAKYILPAPGVTSQAKLNAISNALDPSKPNIVNTDFGTPIVFEASDNIPALMEAVERCNKEIIRNIGIPMPFMGFEDVTNRATVQQVVQVFMETKVEFERSVLQAQLDAQWYDTLLMEFTQKPIEELDYKVALDFEELVFDTFKDKADAVQILTNIGLPISDEAKLEMLGLDNLIDEIEEVKEEIMDEEKEQIEMRNELMDKDKKDDDDPPTPFPKAK